MADRSSTTAISFVVNLHVILSVQELDVGVFFYTGTKGKDGRSAAAQIVSV